LPEGYAEYLEQMGITGINYEEYCVLLLEVSMDLFMLLGSGGRNSRRL